ncbi:hypothetical protein ACFVMC_30245 [Nocardia sp. NPDC127579]|uniref:hypothetical protein n=1 Tax=Nocardia sp. NPDC127579 TaxID=3345402 RepID=UPI00364195E2
MVAVTVAGGVGSGAFATASPDPGAGLRKEVQDKPTRCEQVPFSTSLVCIDISLDLFDRHVTVWYDNRNTGVERGCRFRYAGPDGQHVDQGEFRIDGPGLYSYRWADPPLPSGFYTGILTCEARAFPQPSVSI